MMARGEIGPLLLKDAAALLVAGLPGVQAVYLFGSAARGRLRADSDADFAVLAAGTLDTVTVFETRLRLAAMLGRSVDLVDLRSASPVIARQVLAAGRRLCAPDSTAAARFEMVVPSLYDDLKATRAPVEAALRRRILDAGR